MTEYVTKQGKKINGEMMEETCKALTNNPIWKKRKEILEREKIKLQHHTIAIAWLLLTSYGNYN